MFPRRLGVVVLRSALWSALAAAGITGALWATTSPELRNGFPVWTWAGLFWALALVPSLVMELGVEHLRLHLGPPSPGPSHGERDD